MLHVLIADSAVARLFETADANEPLKEIFMFVNPAARLHERDIVSSRPGRMINRAAGIHQSFDPETSARSHALVRWVQSLHAPLRALLNEHDSDGLILVAAPRLLAALRSKLQKRVKIRGELARNLAGQPVSSFAKRLQPLLRSAAVRLRPDLPIYPSMSVHASKSRTSASVV